MKPSTKKKRSQEPDPGHRPSLSFSPWPLAFFVVSVMFYLFHARIHELLPGIGVSSLRNIAAVAIFYSSG